MTYSNLFGGSSKTVVAEKQQLNQIVVNNDQLIVAPNSVSVSSPQAQQKLLKAKQIKDEVSIAEFGTEAGKEVAAIADIVLQKTTTGKMGDFGDGITDILKLASSVNVDDLNIEKNKGLFGSVTSFFKKKKVEVIANFENTSKSIQKIVDDLNNRQATMRADNQFLEQLYEKNLQEYHELGFSIEAAEALLVEMNQEYEYKKSVAESSQDQFAAQAVNEFEQRIKRWEKQIDRLKRMQHVALLNAPEVRQIQAGNVAMVEKFQDIVATTIPAWKKQLSMTILALRQKENAELGNSIDDKTNEFFKKAADLNHSNAIAVAKNSQRSVVDIETLEHMQNQLIDSFKQVKQIEEQGRQERKAASAKIETLRDQMKKEMMSWGK